jgi:hypothetical protein
VFIAAAAIMVFAVLVWLGRQTRLGRGDWRIGEGLLATAAFVGSVVTGLHGAWAVTMVLDVVGLLLLFDLRRRGAPAAKARTETSDRTMSEAEARAVLGLTPAAGAEEIQAAYLRLMLAVHPDRGGSSPLAAQINAARDRLLGKG